MTSKEAFEILEIAESASLPEIKQAYRDMATVWHPDKYAHNKRLRKKASEKLMYINEAYQVASNHLPSRASKSQHQNENRHASGKYKYFKCINCSALNRTHYSKYDFRNIKCGKCGLDPFIRKSTETNSFRFCGDGLCTGHIGEDSRCGICHKTFDEGKMAEALREEAESTRRAEDANTDWKGNGSLLTWVVLLVAFMIGAVYIYQDSKSNAPVTTSHKSNPVLSPVLHQTDNKRQTQYSPIPELFPENGFVVNLTDKNLEAPLRIITSPGVNYWLRLEEVGTKLDVLDIFARGGEPVEVKAPLGFYKIKWVSGKVWYGNEDKFGAEPYTICNKAKQVFNFKEESDRVIGYTLTLKPVIDGNLKTRRIPLSDF